MNYYIQALKKYTDFSGRARRSEYWFFVLFNSIILIIASVADGMLNTEFEIGEGGRLGYIYLGYLLFTLLPGLAVAVRRLHDVGKSGWFIFISLIPLIGGIWLMVLFFTDSKPGENEYGPNPKGIGNYDEVERVGEHIKQA